MRPRFAQLFGAHLDTLGALLAFLYGLPSWGYAFGRDQAIFFYVGREWAAGRLPYKEAFDIKPPGIYAVYALAGQLLGMQIWSIRVLELFAVLGLGWCIARAVRRDGPPAPGELGAVLLATSGFYYTVFDYWDTGQVEFWEGLFALCGFAAAERVRDDRWAAVVAGLLGGVAVMFKTPVVLMLPVAGVVLLVRAYRAAPEGTGARIRRMLLVAALHCLAGFGVAAFVGSYIALHGGWPALLELVGYTSTYVKNTQTSPLDSIVNVRWFWGEILLHWSIWLGVWWALGIGLAVRRRAYGAVGGALLAALLTALGAASVAAQMKFWSYHWVVIAPFMVLCAAYGLAELGRLRRGLPLALVALATVIAFLRAPRWATTENVTYRSYTGAFWSYVRGTMRRSEFLKQFVGPFGYSYAIQEKVGDAIGELAQPGDRMHVRGFEPSIYANARLASPSRFASEAPITAPTLTYNREAWTAEHDKVLWSALPRFFVTFAGDAADIARIQSHGYHPIGELAPFLWLERNPPPPPPAPPAAEAAPPPPAVVPPAPSPAAPPPAAAPPAAPQPTPHARPPVKASAPGPRRK